MDLEALFSPLVSPSQMGFWVNSVATILLLKWWLMRAVAPGIIHFWFGCLNIQKKMHLYGSIGSPRKPVSPVCFLIWFGSSACQRNWQKYQRLFETTVKQQQANGHPNCLSASTRVEPTHRRNKSQAGVMVCFFQRFLVSNPSKRGRTTSPRWI